MSIDLAITARPAGIVGLRRARTLICVAIFLAEVIALTVSFDTAVLLRETHWSAWLFGYAGLLVHPGMTTLAIALVFGGERLLADLREAAQQSSGAARPATFLAANVVSYSALWRLTSIVLGGQFGELSWPEAVLIGWATAAGATLLSCLALVISPAAWPRLIKRGWRSLALGVLVGVGAWSVGEVTESLWRPLAQGTMWLVVGLLQGLGTDVIYNPAEFVIGTPSFQVAIAAPCSGYEGIGLIGALLAAYFWIYRATMRFPQAFVLLPIGVAMIWLANVGRIAALVLIGEYHSPQLALGGFHTQAGAFAFAAIGLALIAASQRIPWLAKQSTETQTVSAAAPYVMPIIILLAVMMATRAVTAGFDALYPLRVIAVMAALWHYRRFYDTETLVGQRKISPVPQTTYAVLIGVVVFLCWIASELRVGAQPGAWSSSADPTQLPAAWAGIWLIFRAIGSIVTVPIAEELAFRGFMLRRLTTEDFTRTNYERCTWLAVVLSSAAFGILHGRWFAGTLAGLAYAHVAIRRGRLVDAMVAHGTTNLLIAVYVGITGDWQLWG